MRSPPWRLHSSPASRSARASGVRLARRSTRAGFWLAVHARHDVRSDDRCRMVHGILPAARACRAHRRNLTRTSVRCSSVRPSRSCLCCCRRASLSEATFTLALATASTGADALARQTAQVYTANTLGAVAGALAAGFLLVPAFGLQSTFLYTSVVLLVAGFGIIAISVLSC